MTKKAETKEEKKAKDAWVLSKDLPHLSKMLDTQNDLIENLKQEIDGTNSLFSRLEAEIESKIDSCLKKLSDQDLLIDAIKQRVENLTDSMNQILKVTFTKMNELEIAVKRDISKKYVVEATSELMREIFAEVEKKSERKNEQCT